ncbi:aminoacyl-tRNA hydrolase [Patescibacteria group bacterium]|nr:aminoacyl-tRNA hydrolase [Patescibacteria group bacterium]MBP7842007.1 aminoacyl-tRNA hydrolase [Patescibacteria group bacterium]
MQQFNQIIQHIIDHEIFFQFSKSGGKGGQNVNKRETKAELYFDLDASTVLSLRQKQRVRTSAHAYIHGTQIIMTCQEERYQGANKQKVLTRFCELLTKALPEPIKRIATKVPYSQKIKSKQTKIAHSRKKQSRSAKPNKQIDF